MIINDQNLDGIFKGFSTSFNKGLTGAESQFGKVAMTVPSVTSSNTYGWLGQSPRLREWLGDRVIRSVAAHGYTIVNRTFESTVEVPRNSIADDQYGVYAPLVEEMGRAASEAPDEMIFGLLAGGFTTPGYDGQYFFDFDHVVKDVSGADVVVSNFTDGAGPAWYLLDTGRAIRPLVYQERERPVLTSMVGDQTDNVFWRNRYVYGVRARMNAGFGLWQLAYACKGPLTAGNYALARQTMQSLRGGEGRLLGVRPTTLVVPVALEQQGRTLINAATIEASSNPWVNSAELIVSPWLS